VIVEVGRVVKPQGLRGEVVVELISNRAERTKPGAVLGSDRGDLTIASARRVHGRLPERWVVRFQEFSDRSGAEQLRGTRLFAKALQDPDVLWVHELVGSEVWDTSGTRLGVVAAVVANPASDLLELDEGTLVPLRFVTSTELHPDKSRTVRVTVDVPSGLVE